MSTVQATLASEEVRSGAVVKAVEEANSSAPPNPFVGLVPLGERDAALLAGRDDEIRILTTNLRAARLTLVYGASGVGKSSLLGAGVVTTLRNLASEDLNNFGTPSFAVAVISSWAGDPFEELRNRIEEGIKESLEVTSIPPLPATTDLVETIRTCNSTYGLEILLILDQFEEFFLYHEHETGPGTFTYQFPRAVNAGDVRARFLISLRDDYLFKLDRFQNALFTRFENRLQVEPLTVANAEQAIDKAKTSYNESPLAITQVTIENELVKAVLEQVRSDNLTRENVRAGTVSLGLPDTASKAAYVDAPYMQLVMSRLWEEESKRWQKENLPTNMLRKEALVRLGSAQAVVQQHLDKVMQSFSFRERKIASDCFYRLVTPGGSKYALTASELEEWTHHSRASIEAFLEKLADSKYRIVRRVDKKVMNGSQVAYEAHHDRLALAMLDWHNRYEELKSTRKRRLRFLLISGVVMIAIASLFIYQYTTHRTEEAVNIEQQESVKRENLQLTNSLEISAEADNSDRSKVAALRSLVPKLSCGNNNSSIQEDVKQINKILEVDCAPSNEKQLVPRIYLHIQREDQRRAANDLRAWLLAQKYLGRKALVPGIENVGPRNLKNSQIRYFHDTTQELNWAWLVVTSLKDVCVNATPQLIKGYEDSTAIRLGHFELWLTNDSLNNLGCVGGSQAP